MSLTPQSTLTVIPKPTTWIGKDVKRKEDPLLLTGSATYVDDVNLDGMLYAGFVRSSYAHAIIKSVDFSKIKDRSSLILTVEGKDIAVRIQSWMDLPGLKSPIVYSLAPDKVRYAGEPLAAVVTRSRYSAEDAVDGVKVDYELLEPIVNAEEALQRKKTFVFDEWGDNLLYSKHYAQGDADSAISRADVVVEQRFKSHRHSATPIETRGIVASYEKFSGELTVWYSTQMPHPMKSIIAESLQIDESKVRVVAPHVGGGYGVKSNLYQDELTVCQLSMMLGKPVKWIETRREHMLATAHARDQIHYVQAGFDREGRLLGMKDRIVVDFGAGGAIWNSVSPALVTCGSIPGPYKFENFEYDLFCVVTNKTPYGAFRGFGRPVASYVMERVMDIAAAKLRIDPAVVRLKNMVKKDEMPYKSASGLTYDSGDYAEALNRLLQLVDYTNFRKEQIKARKSGRHIGIGLGFYVEFTAPNSSSVINVARKIGGHEEVELTFNSDGTLIARLGVADQGQGHHTVFAQVIAQELGLDIDDISIIEGDTNATPFGLGAIASRCTPTVGGACIAAARKMKYRLLEVAAHVLHANKDDLDIGYRCVIDKKNGRTVPMREITKSAVRAPTTVGAGGGLSVSALYEAPIPPSSYGGHAVTVEVDPETGAFEILRYVVVEDCGVIINTKTVHGQTHGSVVHGISGAILEEFVYANDGQLQSSTFMDYLIATAMDVPHLEVENTVNPGLSLGGFKGMGEGGTIPAAAAISGAVEDALRPWNVTISDLPLSPMNMRRVIKEAK